MAATQVMTTARKVCMGAAGAAGLVTLAGLLSSSATLWMPAAVIASVTAAIGIGAIATLAGYQFTAWILAAVTSAMIYPEYFLQLGPVDVSAFHFPAIDLRNPWLVLVVVQLVMFGMGTKMSLADFAGVIRMPYPVAIGICLQFLIMPLTGYGLARAFGLPAEIAAGVILIGSCSSGLASNVMCYLAGANLALSITLTAVATLLAPLATPFWMKVLAGDLIEVDFLAMMAQIAKIVLIPIGAAMFHDYLKRAPHAVRKSVGFCASILVVAAAALAWGAYRHDWNSLQMATTAAGQWFIILGGAFVFAVAYHFAAQRFAWLDRQMHVVSMFGIVYFTTVTTAAGRDNLLLVGGALIATAILHNCAGYTFGYTASRLFGLDKSSALTVAFEVGMQNGGMASGLAGLMGKLNTVGLAAAVFSPWMNISGSILANQIRRLHDEPGTETGK